jgi:hypothetical protein
MDDIEALASMHGLSREQLRFYPESHGGSVAGRLIVVDMNPATGEAIEVDCARLGSGAYSIPHSVEHLSFRTDAQFILAIETGGMFQRLNKIVLGALLAVMGVAGLFMLMAQEIHRAMGVTAQNVVLRLSGILLAAVAMQFVFDGLAASGLLAAGVRDSEQTSGPSETYVSRNARRDRH